jgi:hypothetical protein
MKFSHRFGYDPTRTTTPIVEDASDWLRQEFLITILDKLAYVDQDSRFKNEEMAPLGIKALNQRLRIETRAKMESEDWDSFYCQDGLHNTITDCEWYQFYDCIEAIGEALQATESKYKIDKVWEDMLGPTSYDRFKFPAYREAVNELFAKHNVAWRLSSEGHFETALPKDLASRITAVEQKLKDEFGPARTHFLKAKAYVLGTQKDPENSIKEAVSALESVCRVLYLKASTLGKALNQMRAEGVCPSKLITAFERFYEYANDEPGIRHGGRDAPAVKVLDAELALHLSIALIRYVIEIKKLKAPISSGIPQ